MHKFQSSLGLSLGIGPILWVVMGSIPITAAPVMAQESVPIEIRRAYVQLGQGVVNQAIEAFKAAIQRYPDSVDAKLGLAIAYRRSGNDEKAFETYQLVLAQDPKNLLALRSVGVLGGYKPEWQEKGINALTKLLELNSTDREARAQRALLYGYQGKFSESLSDYESVLKTGKIGRAHV